MSNINVVGTKEVFRKSSSFTQEIKYNRDNALTPPVRVNNFTQKIGVTQTKAKEGEPVIFISNEPIQFNTSSRIDLIDNYSYNIGDFTEIPNRLEYLKYRISFITLNKKNIRTIRGPQPTEGEFQEFKDDDITITIRNADSFPIFRDSVTNRNNPAARNPPQDGDIINYKVSRTQKSEWIELETGQNNLNGWTLELAIAHSEPALNPPLSTTDFTHRQIFLKQRLFSITIGLEFEYKIAKPIQTLTDTEEEKITMENLYKMMSSFFSKKRRIINKKLDAIDNNLLEEFEKKEKQKGVYLPDPLTKEEIELFTDQILKRMSGK